MQDPKPNLSTAALKCNRDYWRSVLDASLDMADLADDKIADISRQEHEIFVRKQKLPSQG